MMPKEGSGVVNYPGGKTTLAPWVISHIPAHETYVEPFGGSAAILHNKPRSGVEVYNDRQSDIVHLFRMIRDRPDDLVEWLRATPYSREQHAEFTAYFDERPEDPIERAGQFFYLLQTSYSGELRSPSFGTTTRRSGTAYSRSEKFARSKRNLYNVAERFETVTIENLDYREVFSKYDHDAAFFYCDPPYLTDTKHYLDDEFDHESFLGELETLEGKWIVSYDALPAGFEEFHIVSRERSWTMGDGEGSEKLVMNYNPETTPKFSPPEQMTLAGVGD